MIMVAVNELEKVYGMFAIIEFFYLKFKVAMKVEALKLVIKAVKIRASYSLIQQH